jgi:hypothetical protein
MDCVWVGKKYKKSYTVHRFYHIKGTESWIIRQGKIQYVYGYCSTDGKNTFRATGILYPETESPTAKRTLDLFM